jgi:hypothetical protein
VRIQITDGASTAGADRGVHLIKGGIAGYLYNYENGPLIFGTNGTERMTIDNVGNVGIGTNDPIGRLHLHRENATFSQSVNLHFTDTLTGRTATDGFLIGKGTDNFANIYNNENTPMVFATNGGEKMRISAIGNVGIGISPNYKLDVNGDVYVGNNSYYLSDHTGTASSQFFGKKYITTILGGMEIENTTLGGNYSQKLHFHTHTYGGSYGRRMTINEAGNVNTTGNIIAGTYLLANGRVYSRGGGFDTWIYSDGGGMTLNMGSQSTENAPSCFRMGAYGGHTLYESNSNRNHRFFIYTGTFSGTSREWRFNEFGNAFNALNSTAWTIASDQRIKKDIIKADLKTCYDNVKNINLYRFKYIDAFDSEYQDKNKLGYIAQEVKRHFPKATYREKRRLNDKREIPDLLNIDTEQINLSLYGAVKQLIKIVEKQNKRIKTLETLLNIDDNDDVENDAGEAYERIHDENEIDIDTIEPTEPEQDRAPMGVSSPSDEGVEEIEEINVD